jgi:putative DNA primase/helicase
MLSETGRILEEEKKKAMALVEAGVLPETIESEPIQPEIEEVDIDELPPEEPEIEQPVFEEDYQPQVPTNGELEAMYQNHLADEKEIADKEEAESGDYQAYLEQQEKLIEDAEAEEKRAMDEFFKGNPEQWLEEDKPLAGDPNDIKRIAPPKWEEKNARWGECRACQNRKSDDEPDCKKGLSSMFNCPSFLFDAGTVFGDKKTINPYNLARLLKRRHYFYVDDDDTLYLYNEQNGYYKKVGKEIDDILIDFVKSYYRINLGKEVKKVLEGLKNLNIKPLPLSMIPVKNGLINLDNDRLEPFNPKYFYTTKINTNYDPNAKCELWEEKITEILPEEKFRLTLQEFSGFMLYRDYLFHKFLLLIGRGRNGKGVYLIVMKEVLGTKNIEAIDLEYLMHNKFIVAQLHYKLANLGSEIPRSTIYLERVKRLSGGEQVQGEMKFGTSFNFSNYAKLVFAGNELPYIADTSDAALERLLIIPFEQFFPEGDPKTDPNLKFKLTTEEMRSGILNWMLVGLKRLLKEERFTYKMDSEELNRVYIKLGNIVKTFMETQIIDNEYGRTEKATIYEHYCTYCKRRGLTPKAYHIFNREFSSEARTERRRIFGETEMIGGVLTTYWKGVEPTYEAPDAPDDLKL